MIYFKKKKVVSILVLFFRTIHPSLFHLPTRFMKVWCVSVTVQTNLCVCSVSSWLIWSKRPHSSICRLPCGNTSERKHRFIMDRAINLLHWPVKMPNAHWTYSVICKRQCLNTVTEDKAIKKNYLIRLTLWTTSSVASTVAGTSSTQAIPYTR